jgi:hypothetical protein
MTRYDHLLGAEAPTMPPLPELRAQVATLQRTTRPPGTRQSSVHGRSRVWSVHIANGETSDLRCCGLAGGPSGLAYLAGLISSCHWYA